MSRFSLSWCAASPGSTDLANSSSLSLWLGPLLTFGSGISQQDRFNFLGPRGPFIEPAMSARPSATMSLHLLLLFLFLLHSFSFFSSFSSYSFFFFSSYSFSFFSSFCPFTPVQWSPLSPWWVWPPRQPGCCCCSCFTSDPLDGPAFSNDHPDGPAFCKWSSGLAGLMQIIIRMDRPFANDHRMGRAILILNLPTNNYKSYNSKGYQKKPTKLPTIKLYQANIKEKIQISQQ